MNRKKSFEITEELLNKIISVAYEDAPLLDKIKVMHAASRNNEVRNLLNSHKTIANEVKQLGEEEFPRELYKSIENRTVPVKKTTDKFIYDLISIVLSKPIVSAATSVILIAAIIASLIINKPVQYNYNYSTAEITEAEKQAEYAFEVVGKLFKETHFTLQKEVFGNAVAKPFGQSIRIVNNLLKGDKNETN
jgi:hypothetical protein